MTIKRTAASVLLLPGLVSCVSLNKALDSADHALSVLQNPTVTAVTKIANADDRSGAAKALLSERKDAYRNDPRTLIKDVRQFKNDFESLSNLLTGNVRKTWGNTEVRVATRTTYVKYTQNYQSRAVVDFDKGTVLVETVDDKDPRASLRNALVTTLLTPDDPRSVDLFTDSQIELSSDKPPYLLNLVADHKGWPVNDPAGAESFADHLLGGMTTREVQVEGGTRTASFVQFGMVPKYEHKQAERYRPLAAKYGEKYGVSPSLVLAVIRTESNFNPFAVSSAPAYGMMQLVPTSGGREAYRHVSGSDGIPTREYLFDAERNIELGTAYLGRLQGVHLVQVGSALSREYCAIAAYNTGPGNVFKTFGKGAASAVNAINSMQPPAVFEKLRTKLPYEETRDYLVKVTQFRRQFVAPGG